MQKSHQTFSFIFTAYGYSQPLMLALICLIFAACGSGPLPQESTEEEPESRTEFTERVENFFEHERLKAGKPSHFLIHLTDLEDGSPVEKADVTLTIRAQNEGAEVGQTKARTGKVTGIYVADVKIAEPGIYGIEFHIKNAKLDERMPLKDFKVE